MDTCPLSPLARAYNKAESHGQDNGVCSALSLFLVHPSLCKNVQCWPLQGWLDETQGDIGKFLLTWQCEKLALCSGCSFCVYLIHSLMGHFHDPLEFISGLSCWLLWLLWLAFPDDPFFHLWSSRSWHPLQPLSTEFQLPSQWVLSNESVGNFTSGFTQDPTSIHGNIFLAPTHLGVLCIQSDTPASAHPPSPACLVSLSLSQMEESGTGHCGSYWKRHVQSFYMFCWPRVINTTHTHSLRSMTK